MEYLRSSFFFSSLLDSMKQHPEIFVSVACISIVVYLQFLRTKRDPSVAWPIVGMLPSLLWNFNRLHDHCTDILQLLGCTAFFKGPWFAGMDFLMTCDPANVKHILNTNFANYPKGDEFLEMFDILGNGIFNSDDETWKSQRRITHGLMAEKKFRHFVIETTREKMKTAMIPMLDEAMGKNSVLDLQDLFLRLTFDLTSTLVMGVDPCCMSPGLPTVPFARAIDDCMETILVRHIVPTFWWKMMRRLGIGSENKIASAWETIENFVSKNVSMKKKEASRSKDDDDRNNSEHHSPDMMTSWLSNIIEEEEEDKDHSIAFLRDMVINLMLAGRDTIASGLSWFFYLISQNPHVESKILEELKENPKVCEVEGEMEASDLNSLTYIHACLCESLRLYPPVPFEHKGAVHQDMLPSSHKVKPSSRILISLYSMARIEDVWGVDCKEYRPERWIDSVTGKIRYEPSYKFSSFNSGPRTCLGKDIAFTQMKLVVAAVLSRFHVELVQGHVVVPKPSILLHMNNGLMIKIKNRLNGVQHIH